MEEGLREEGSSRDGRRAAPVPLDTAAARRSLLAVPCAPFHIRSQSRRLGVAQPVPSQLQHVQAG